MKLNSLEELGQFRNNAVVYSGLNGFYQREGKSKVKYQQQKLSLYQYELYNRALRGLKAYSEEELEKMSSVKKKRISKVHRRAVRCLNIYKQEITNGLVKFLVDVFNNSKQAKVLFSDEIIATDPKFINNLGFRKLGITQSMIIDRLMQDGIFPANFYELK